jgi:ribosomal subunit interface protein
MGGFMNIKITSRHEKASTSLQETIKDEVAKIEKFNDRIASCHVILDKERTAHILEIVVNMAHHTLSAKAKSEKLGKALDQAITKIERQVIKISEKVKNHKYKKIEE